MNTPDTSRDHRTSGLHGNAYSFTLTLSVVLAFTAACDLGVFGTSNGSEPSVVIHEDLAREQLKSYRANGVPYLVIEGTIESLHFCDIVGPAPEGKEWRNNGQLSGVTVTVTRIWNEDSDLPMPEIRSSLIVASGEQSPHLENWYALSESRIIPLFYLTPAFSNSPEEGVALESDCPMLSTGWFAVGSDDKETFNPSIAHDLTAGVSPDEVRDALDEAPSQDILVLASVDTLARPIPE